MKRTTPLTTTLKMAGAVAILLAGCAGYEDEVRPPTDQQLQDARSSIKPRSVLREGVFHMQRIQNGSPVRVKEEIHLKKTDLPPFDVAVIWKVWCWNWPMPPARAW